MKDCAGRKDRCEPEFDAQAQRPFRFLFRHERIMPVRQTDMKAFGRAEAARFQARSAKGELMTEGLRHEIPAEAKSDGVHGVRDTVGDVRGNVDAEALELAVRHVQRGDRNDRVSGAVHQ